MMEPLSGARQNICRDVGTLNLCTFLSSETKAKELPVLTISSGPTNSMRGAAFLSGVEDAVVIDIGGTTTDVGVIKSGFPREASGYAKVPYLKFQ